MDYRGFLQEVSQRKEFERLKVFEPEGNLVSYTGHVIGKDVLERFEKLARRYGLIMLSDKVNVWNTEELYQEFKDVPVREV